MQTIELEKFYDPTSLYDIEKYQLKLDYLINFLSHYYKIGSFKILSLKQSFSQSLR